MTKRAAKLQKAVFGLEICRGKCSASLHLEAVLNLISRAEDFKLVSTCFPHSGVCSEPCPWLCYASTNYISSLESLRFPYRNTGLPFLEFFAKLYLWPLDTRWPSEHTFPDMVRSLRSCAQHWTVAAPRNRPRYGLLFWVSCPSIPPVQFCHLMIWGRRGIAEVLG